MSLILCLKPNCSRQEALDRFIPVGLSGILTSMAGGPLRMIADAYVPFQLYRVEITNAARRESVLIAVDAVCGRLDPYRFENVPGAAELVEIETRNRPEPLLDAARVGEIAAEKVRRMIYSTGFFHIRNLAIRAESVPLEIHVPYWIGFFGSGKRARLAVLDAVRRRREGGKARRFFYEWLAPKSAVTTPLKDEAAVQALPLEK
jgi:hypothetical protein